MQAKNTFSTYLLFSLAFIVIFSVCNGNKIVFEQGKKPSRSMVLGEITANVTTGNACGEVSVTRSFYTDDDHPFSYIKVERLDNHPVESTASIINGGQRNMVTLSFNAGLSPEPVTLTFKASMEHATAYCPPICD